MNFRQPGYPIIYANLHFKKLNYKGQFWLFVSGIRGFASPDFSGFALIVTQKDVLNIFSRRPYKYNIFRLKMSTQIQEKTPFFNTLSPKYYLLLSYISIIPLQMANERFSSLFFVDNKFHNLLIYKLL